MKIEDLTADQIDKVKRYFENEIAEAKNHLDHIDVEDMSEENLMREMQLEGQLASLEYSKASFLSDVKKRMVTDGD